MEKIIPEKTAILFPGQGSQFPHMGRDLYDTFPEVRDMFEVVSEAVKKDMKKIIFSDDAEKLTLTTNAQPAIMLISMAVLVTILKQSNKSIDAIGSVVAGHSLGEYSALCAAKAISLEDTAALLDIRAKSMSEATDKSKLYGMSAVLGCTIDDVSDLLKRANMIAECDLANDNGGGQFVLSGEKIALDFIAENARNYNIKKVINLNVSSAFHSRFMVSARYDILNALSKFEISKPKIPIVSNYTAKSPKNISDIKENLVNQVSNTVLWRESMVYMNRKLGIRNFIEMGPGTVLSKLAERTIGDCRSVKICSLKEIEAFIEEL